MGKEKGKRTLIGGQALMEGVMMRGATSMAMAVRDDKGEIRLETSRLNGKKWYSRIPIVRGVAAFVSSLVTGVTTLMKSTEVSTPDEDMPGKGAMAFAVVLGVLLAVGLFILAPSGIVWLFERFLGLNNLLAISLIEGGLRLLIFIAYLAAVSKIKDIRRTFMYHGAEHRTINCFEKGLDLTVENVQSCSTRHNRCGTTFLFFVMIISIVVFALTNWGFSYLGDWSSNVLIRFAIRIALLPFVAGLSYELLRGLALLPDNKFTFMLRAPGLALQRLTTYPPDDEMAEVAIKSFNAVYEMDNNPQLATVKFNEIPVNTIKSGIKKRLPVVAEECETELILCEAMGVRRSDLIRYTTTSVSVRDKAYSIAEKRAEGIPLSYIIGYTEFFGYRINVGEGVLIPRQDTERVAERAINLIGEREAEVLDLCTGSGCIALAICKNTAAKVTAADISEKALEYAKKNLEGTNANIVLSDMFSSLGEAKYDVIVCNPPYIASDVISGLSAEVKREPIKALDGGADGLDFYRRLKAEAPKHLNKGGTLILEIGYDQGKSVPEIFGGGKVEQDYSDNDRVFVIEF